MLCVTSVSVSVCRVAVSLNIAGLRNVLQLCKQMSQLEVCYSLTHSLLRVLNSHVTVQLCWLMTSNVSAELSTLNCLSVCLSVSPSLRLLISSVDEMSSFTCSCWSLWPSVHVYACVSVTTLFLFLFSCWLTHARLFVSRQSLLPLLSCDIALRSSLALSALWHMLTLWRPLLPCGYKASCAMQTGLSHRL